MKTLSTAFNKFEMSAFMGRFDFWRTTGRSRQALSARTRGQNQGVKPLFTLGRVVATPGSLAAIEKSGQQPGEFVACHVSGDWGDLRPEDIKNVSHHWPKYIMSLLRSTLRPRITRDFTALAETPRIRAVSPTDRSWSSRS
jgi:hypothetical protein